MPAHWGHGESCRVWDRCSGNSQCVVGGDLLLAVLQFHHLVPARACVVCKSIKQRELQHILRLALSPEWP